MIMQRTPQANVRSGEREGEGGSYAYTHFRRVSNMVPMAVVLVSPRQDWAPL